MTDNKADSVHSHWIELVANDGHRLAAFEALAVQPSRGTVVVAQEIFGVNPHMQKMAVRLAEQGYTAVVPALFDRVQTGVSLPYNKEGIEQGKALVAAIAAEAALLDMAAAAAHRAEGGAVFVLGFCWGGTLAWLAASRLAVAGVIAYYGGQIGAHLDKAPRCPVLAHFGEHDASIPMAVSQAIAQDMPTVINHVYPAGHGFNCDERASFDAVCASQAWVRSLGFLAALA